MGIWFRWGEFWYTPPGGPPGGRLGSEELRTWFDWTPAMAGYGRWLSGGAESVRGGLVRE